MSDKDYEEQKKLVTEQKKNKKINPGDVYKLAQLMVRWKANDRLPVCLLCQDPSKKPESLGHLIPHSILREAGQKYFADLNQRKEFGTKKMGYYAFCQDCEKRFQMGENHLNPKFYHRFFHHQEQRMEVKDVINNDDKDIPFPWLYYSFVSIVWRCMCFVPMPEVDHFISVLEVLRAYLLNHTDKEAVDSSVKLFVFAPSKDVDDKLAKAGPAQKVCREMFYGTFHAHVFCPLGQERFGWVLMGPVHVLLVYSEDKRFCSADVFLGKEDCKKAIDHCELKTTTQPFVIADKETRFFPMAEMYDPIVELETHAIVSTATIRIRITEQGNNPARSMVLSASHLYLLPSGVTYKHEFEYPTGIYRTISKLLYTDDTEILFLWKGDNERVAFVTTLVKINDEYEWRFAVGLTVKTVNGAEEVDYMEDIFIPGPDKIGVDFTKLPIEFKEPIEQKIREYLKKVREDEKMSMS